MTQMSKSQSRVVDPILSTVAQGYRNADMIGMSLFPYVPVGQRGGKIIQFGREDFRLYSTARAPGAQTRRVQFGYTGASYALDQHALEGVVPYELMEEANEVPGIDLAKGAVTKTQNIIALRLEKAQADLATTAGNYAAANKTTLAGANQWSDYTGTSNPNTDIETAKDAVRAKVGKRANTVAMGAAVFAKLKYHPVIIDRIKYTGRDSATPELLANLWGVKQVLIGDAVYENAAGALADVWGKFVVVAYTEMASLADFGAPSYGYTYRLGGYPIVEAPYNDRPSKSWIYPVTDEVSPVQAAVDAGYLISAAVA